MCTDEEDWAIPVSGMDLRSAVLAMLYAPRRPPQKTAYTSTGADCLGCSSSALQERAPEMSRVLGSHARARPRPFLLQPRARIPQTGGEERTRAIRTRTRLNVGNMSVRRTSASGRVGNGPVQWLAAPDKDAATTASFATARRLAARSADSHSTRKAADGREPYRSQPSSSDRTLSLDSSLRTRPSVLGPGSVDRGLQGRDGESCARTMARAAGSS